MKRCILVLAAALTLMFTLCACSGIFNTAVPEPPVLSHETGSYADSFTLTVTSAKGADVRYTLDGSDPTADSPEFPGEGLLIEDRTGEPNVLAAIPGAEFTVESTHTPPNVTKCTVIKTAAFNRKGECSEIVTATYLVGLEYEDIKVVSLVLDSEDLFDYEKGIYIFGKVHDDWMTSDPNAKYAETWEVEGNFSQTGREWEREVCVQVIDEEGRLGIEQDMGIRIMGTASRRHYQKSFRLVAREEYGEKHFDYELIDGLTADGTGEPLTRYKSFVLRNGGNDNGYSHIRDQFIQSRVTDRAFATQAAEPCIVFINGEYWGLYTITEDYSDNYIQYNFGVDNENVVLIKKGQLEEGTDGDLALFEEVSAQLTSRDFSVAEDYEWFCNTFDVQSFIDHAAVHIYINNEDGLFHDNNWRIWRARTTDPSNPYSDGKWRFMLYDTEYSLGLYEDGRNYADNSLEHALESGNFWSEVLKNLMGNEEFRARFVNTIMDMRNVAFERIEAGIAVLAEGAGYRPYAPEQYERNGPQWVIEWSDTDTRFGSESGIVKNFLTKRYRFVPQMITETLGIGDSCAVVLKSNEREGGTVTVNTVSVGFENGAHSLDYFAEFPVTFTAQPAPGYFFTGWSGDVESTDSTITPALMSVTSLTANFERE